MSKVTRAITLSEEVDALIKIHQMENTSFNLSGTIDSFLREFLTRDKTEDEKEVLKKIHESKNKIRTETEIITQLFAQKKLIELEKQKKQLVSNAEFRAIKKYGIDGFLPDD